MNLIKRFFVTSNPVNETVTYGLEMEASQLYIHRCLIDDIVKAIVDQVSKAYVEQHGDKILQAIEAKTIDAKVIQKVVANLRKELR